MNGYYAGRNWGGGGGGGGGHTLEPGRHVLRGQFRMGSILAGLSSHPTTRATNSPIGMARRSLSELGFLHCSGVVNDEGVESYLKATRHLPVDHYGQVEQALCPYFFGLGVHVGQLLVGFRLCWSLSGSVSVRSPAVSGLHAHVIRPFVWATPLISPQSPDAIRETDLQWVGSLGC